MIRNPFRTLRTPATALPRVPDGERVYAIGDIHGCDDALAALLARIDADDAARGQAATRLIVLGDVVDRGPESAAVVERLMRLAAERPATRFLQGNHEEVFLSALGGDREALRFFCRIGGRETILSYGMTRADYDLLGYEELAERLGEMIPAAHRDFLESFEDMVVAGDYAFVHAGIRPDVPLEEQSRADLRWIRTTFLEHRGAHPKVIVHGHTITDEVDFQPHRIGVDTGAYRGGALSAVGFEATETWVV
jgi:serine/threonine protein phosphatase 1